MKENGNVAHKQANEPFRTQKKEEKKTLPLI